MRDVDEPGSRIHEVAENMAIRFRFTSEKERGRFIEKCLCKGRIALNALDNGFFESTGQRHDFFPFLGVARNFLRVHPGGSQEGPSAPHSPIRQCWLCAFPDSVYVFG